MTDPLQRPDTPMSERLNLELKPADTERLANLCGQFDQHLKQIESRLQVDLFCRGNLFTVQGEPRQARAASRLLKQLYTLSDTELLKFQRPKKASRMPTTLPSSPNAGPSVAVGPIKSVIYVISINTRSILV